MKLKRLAAGAIAASLISVVALAAPGHKPGEGHSHADDTDYGKPGDPKKPARIVQIVFREDDGKMLFLPDKLKFKKGEQVRFQLRNNGAIDHEFVVGTVEENLKHMKDMEKNPDMEHDDPNAKRLKLHHALRRETGHRCRTKEQAPPDGAAILSAITAGIAEIVTALDGDERRHDRNRDPQRALADFPDREDGQHG